MKRVADYIRKYHLLTIEGKYLVALSGGADSVALLLVLRQLGYQVEAVHCNFHLRGKESDHDEQFCRQLCEKHNVSFHVAHFDTVEYANLHHVSIEMAARELRYHYFGQLAHDIGADGVCVAHHRDDSVETVMLNLIRGTGIDGLRGIQPVNGLIIRPLLCVGRDDVLCYLAEIHQDYVTDSSNLVDDVARNKIRLNILPAMREINPSVSDSIAATSRRLVEVAAILNDVMAEKAKKVLFEKNLQNNSLVTVLKKDLIDSEHLLFYLLSPYGFSPAQIEMIYARLDSPTGTCFESSTHQLLFDRNEILIRKKPELSLEPMRIPESGTYVYAGKMKFRFSFASVEDFHKMPYKEANYACLDAAAISFPLIVRQVAQGDWFIPFGMKGKKLLSDYMTDRKMTLFEKQEQLVLTEAGGNVIWLVNQRPDNRYCVTPSTKRILMIECEMMSD
ncbi:MAG: tRNA lysidine(34) synthetase TilS [Prevotella sp.]|nr:tRNA lysidine(34) synthetase TilS [Prevotella sp.]